LDIRKTLLRTRAFKDVMALLPRALASHDTSEAVA